MIMRFKAVFAVVLFVAGAGCGGGQVVEDVSADVIEVDAADVAEADIAVGDTLVDAGRDALVVDSGQDVTADVPSDVTMDTREAYTQDLPAEICRTGTVWAPASTEKAFTDITADSALPDLGVTGIRAGTVDFDNDGLPDLVIRNVEQDRDNFAEGGARRTWLLRNVGGFRFEDVTEASGFTATRDESAPQGRVTHAVVWGDVDNDGDLDAFSGRSMTSKPNPDNGDRAELLLNTGNGTFMLAPKTDFWWMLYNEKVSETAQMYDPVHGASFLDYNRDGLLDIFVGYATYNGSLVAQDSLYRGDGAGGFVNVTEEAGLNLAKPMIPYEANAAYKNGTAIRNTWGTTVTDLNNDGWPDIMSACYGRYFNALWLGGPEGFTDWSMGSGYASDDREDWTTNINAQCYCKLEPEAEDCEGVPDPPSYLSCTSTANLRWDHAHDREPYRLGGNTFSTVSGDVDNDGDMDLFNFEIVHWDVGDTSDPAELLVNDGAAQPTFSRPGNEAMGIVRDWGGEIDWNAGDMTGALFDFDNDGRLDVLIASSDYPYTRAFLYHQKADGKFEEVPTDVGIAHPHAHGVAVADFDLDGDLDVVLGHSTARCDSTQLEECYHTFDPLTGTTFRREVHAFRNDLGQDGNWLRINLVGGEGTNRAAIGAVVKVTANGVTQMREVGGGHGHVGIQHEMTQHFGLGDACNVERLEIRWPDAAGTVEVFHNVRGNYMVTIEQGTGLIDYGLAE